MKNLNRHIFILLLLISTVFASYAQHRIPVNAIAAQHRPVREIKREYIAQHLGLTAEQNTKFVPIYEQYQSEYEGLIKARRTNNTIAEPGPDQFDRDIVYQQKTTALQKHYYEEFSKLITPEKASQVFKSEKDFNIELVKRLKEGGSSGNPPLQ